MTYDLNWISFLRVIKWFITHNNQTIDWNTKKMYMCTISTYTRNNSVQRFIVFPPLNRKVKTLGSISTDLKLNTNIFFQKGNISNLYVAIRYTKFLRKLWKENIDNNAG